MDKNDWHNYIIPAHDGLLPLKDIIEKLKLIHVQDARTKKLIPLIEFESQHWDTPHMVGYLRQQPLGKEWAVYLLTHLNDNKQLLHKVMAKRIRSNKA
jgi:hypothetical protein